nr:hypothetical protein CFP56_64104 [Quercus suber]
MVMMRMREETRNVRFGSCLSANAHVFHNRDVTEVCDRGIGFVVGSVQRNNGVRALFVLIHDDEDVLRSHCEA